MRGARRRGAATPGSPKCLAWCGCPGGAGTGAGFLGAASTCWARAAGRARNCSVARAQVPVDSLRLNKPLLGPRSRPPAEAQGLLPRECWSLGEAGVSLRVSEQSRLTAPPRGGPAGGWPAGAARAVSAAARAPGTHTLAVSRGEPAWEPGNLGPGTGVYTGQQ